MTAHGFCANLNSWWATIDGRYLDSAGNLWRYAADGEGGCLFVTESDAIAVLDRRRA